MVGRGHSGSEDPTQGKRTKTEKEERMFSGGTPGPVELVNTYTVNHGGVRDKTVEIEPEQHRRVTPQIDTSTDTPSVFSSSRS